MSPHRESHSMNQTHAFSLTSLALAASLLLGACSSLPADNATLMSARAAFNTAQNTAQTRELAPAELAAAGAALKPGSARDMDKLAVFFKTYPQRTAIVEGFTDSVGSDASNQDLSNRRVEIVLSDDSGQIKPR